MLSRGAAAPRAVLLVRTVQTAVAIGPTGVHRAGGSLIPAARGTGGALRAAKEPRHIAGVELESDLLSGRGLRRAGLSIVSVRESA
jgi:hypothetical protein